MFLSGHHGFNGFRGALAKRALELILNLFADRIVAESQTSEADGDYQKRSNGKDGIVGEGGAEADNFIFAEFLNCSF